MGKVVKLPEGERQFDGRCEPMDFAASVAALIVVVFVVLLVLSFVFKTVRWLFKAAMFLAILGALAFLAVHLWG